MGCLTVIIFGFNILLALLVDGFCFTLCESSGVPTWITVIVLIISAIAFLLGYALSAEVAIAPRDFWRQSSLEILKKKIGYAWSAKAIVWAIVCIPAAVI